MFNKNILKNYISKGNLELAIQELNMWFEKLLRASKDSPRLMELHNEFIHITGLYKSSQNDTITINSLTDIILIRAKSQIAILSIIDSIAIFCEEEQKEKLKSAVVLIFTIPTAKISLFESKIDYFADKILVYKKDINFSRDNQSNDGITIKQKIPIENAFHILSYFRGGALKEFGICHVELYGEEKKLIEVLEKPKSRYYEENILFTTIRAFAGSTLGAESAEDNKCFSIPGVTGSGLVAFQIEGNSMEPIIKHSDIVVCRSVSNFKDIKNNELYAVRSSGNVWVKYIAKMYNDRGRVTKIKMISSNHFDHDPFEEEINETTRLYRVIRIISSF